MAAAALTSTQEHLCRFHHVAIVKIRWGLFCAYWPFQIDTSIISVGFGTAHFMVKFICSCWYVGCENNGQEQNKAVHTCSVLLCSTFLMLFSWWTYQRYIFTIAVFSLSCKTCNALRWVDSIMKMLGLWLCRGWLFTHWNRVFVFFLSFWIQDALQHGIMHPICWNTSLSLFLMANEEKQRLVTYCFDEPTYILDCNLCCTQAKHLHMTLSFCMFAWVYFSLRSGQGIRAHMECLQIVAASGFLPLPPPLPPTWLEVQYGNMPFWVPVKTHTRMKVQVKFMSLLFEVWELNYSCTILHIL